MQFSLNYANWLAAHAVVAVVNTFFPSAVVIVAAWTVLRWKGWNAASRYWAWWLTLLLVVLMPCAALFRRPAVVPSAVRSVVLKASPEIVQVHDFSSVVTTPAAPSPLPSGPALILLLCGLAVSAGLTRLTLGLIAGVRLKRNSVVPLSETLRSVFTSAAQRIESHRPVRLVISKDISAPVALGYLKPYIAIPALLVEHLEIEEIEQVLAHELAHIRRRDDWMILAQRFIEALFIFHPLVHYLSRRIDLDREMACDDCVLCVSPKPKQYAACLTKIAEMVEFRSAVALTVPLLARKSHLAIRVERMLDKTRAHLPSFSAAQLLPFAIGTVFAAYLSLNAPALLASPAQSLQPSAKSIDSIAVTSSADKTTTFESNGNEHLGQSPFPRSSIVFSRNGASYIIRDRATVDAAREILRPQEELSRQQEQLGAKQAKLGEQQAKLGEQQATITNRQLDPPAMKTLEKQLRDLEVKLRSIDLEKSVRTATEAQERLAELQSQLGSMQSRMGDEQGKIGEAQGKLGQEQGVLGEEQGRLGEQQGRLGEQQAREAKRAEQKLEEIVRRAESQGLAQPLR